MQLDDAAADQDAACALLSTLGVMLRDHEHPTLGVVDLPWALLTRTARVLDNAADRVRRGAPLPSGADETIRHDFADRLAEDAAVLRQLSDNRIEPPPRPPLRAI